MVGMKCFRRALTSLSVAFALLHVAALGVAGLPISQHDRHGGLGRENPAPLSSILENATTFLPDAPPRTLKAEMATSAQQVEVRIFL